MTTPTHTLKEAIEIQQELVEQVRETLKHDEAPIQIGEGFDDIEVEQLAQFIAFTLLGNGWVTDTPYRAVESSKATHTYREAEAPATRRERVVA